MILIPLLLAFVWGVFAVSGDPSRSGKTVVKTPGIIRLFLEFSIFTIGAFAIFKSGYSIFSYIFSGVVILHYLLSYDRIVWLIKQK